MQESLQYHTAMETKQAVVDERGATRTFVLTCILACLLTMVMLFPLLIEFISETSDFFGSTWQLDQSEVESIMAGIGPAGISWYQTVCVLIAAMLFYLCLRNSVRMHWLVLVLTAVGMMACGYHMSRHYNNLLICGSWFAASVLGLAIMHAAGSHDMIRRCVIAGMVAILLPITLEACWYVLVDHPNTVDMYLANEHSIIAGRGWEIGSAEHIQYRRRLMGGDVIGVIGLSNVFGSVVAGLTILAGSLAVGFLRTNKNKVKWDSLLCGLVTIGGILTVILTQSKGAVLALLIGCGIFTLSMIIIKYRGGYIRYLPLLSVAMLIMVMAVIWFRGFLGPPNDWEGERSLLFRYHYLQAAKRIVLSDPPDSLVYGVGPDGFKKAYLWAKNPINPEEVPSTHNVFADYVTMLGLGGWCFAAVLVIFLVKSGWNLKQYEPRLEPDEQTAISAANQRVLVYLALIITSCLFGCQYYLLYPQLWWGNAAIWSIQATVFFLIFTCLSKRQTLMSVWTKAGLFAASTSILTHNMLEMGFYQPSSTVFLWSFIAFAAVGSGRASAVTNNRPINYPTSLVFLTVLAIAMVTVSYYSIPVTRYQRLLRAAPCKPELLDKAAVIYPLDESVLKDRISLRLMHARVLASPENVKISPMRIEAQILNAKSILEQAENDGLAELTYRRYLAHIDTLAGDLLGSEFYLEDAAENYRQTLLLDPYNVTMHLDLADLYWKLGQYENAEKCYRESLHLSDLNYLDPARQLNQDRRHGIEQKLHELESRSNQ